MNEHLHKDWSVKTVSIISSKAIKSHSGKLASSKRSGSLPPSRHSGNSVQSSPNTSFNSSTSTTNLGKYQDVYYRMSYVLVSTDDFHRGPTRISTIDPYLHEKVPFTAEPQYDPHGRYWKFRVEDAPVRVLSKLTSELGYKVLTGANIAGPYDHKQPGHAWTLFRDPNTKVSILNNH
ncbi:hypothetical protein RDWZM_003038 [Blomia tropicalis]|uniref:Uncharacterized protein n=1 Tax=Blomia tropicalis TaxID=40697 RepID=A0A9Q0MDX7_BLOTA|nr:hypothetical protein RDWZM_003038 [Blomia tropicalis]